MSTPVCETEDNATAAMMRAPRMTTSIARSPAVGTGQQGRVLHELSQSVGVCNSRGVPARGQVKTEVRRPQMATMSRPTVLNSVYEDGIDDAPGGSVVTTS
jgi:hypothetical protein